MASPKSPRLVDEAAPVEDERTPLINGRPHGPADGTAEQTIIPKEQSKSRLVITLASCYVGVFLGALDSTIVATLAAPISTSFNSLSLLSWFASAYLISNAACQPLAGRLTDIFSRKTGLVFSNVMFGVGNLICGLATNEQMIIAGRVVAGVGGGGLMAISTFVASDLVPLRQRGVVQGLGNICYGTGAGLGGLFGGWINDTWGWRWAFLVQVPFIVVSGLLVFFLINVPAKKSSKSKLKRVDFLGAITIVVTLVLLLLGLNSGGNIVPWDHPLVLVSLPLSVVMLGAFIYIEAFVAFEPVIPVRLLLDQTVLASCLVNWFTTMVTYMVLFYTPLFFQAKGLSTTSAGVRLIPQSIGSSVGSIGSGLLMNKTGKYQKLGLALMIVFTLGSGLLNTLTFSTPEGPAFAYLFCIGFGYGGILTVTLLAVISAVSHDHQAVITSATYAFRSTGSTIGITIASTVYQNILKSELWEKFGDRPGAADEIKRIRNSFNELKHLPEGWKTGVLQAYGDALRGVFLTSLVVSVLACVAALFIKQHVLHSSLDRRSSHSNGST